MAKYDKFRLQSGSAMFSWVGQTITCAVVSGYTFNVAHVSMADVTAAGGVILATGKVINKTILSNGTAQSTAVSVRLVPAGGPYSVLLLSGVNGQPTQLYPIVHYPSVTTLATSGDLLIRPEGSVGSSAGSWFTF